MWSVMLGTLCTSCEDLDGVCLRCGNVPCHETDSQPWPAEFEGQCELASTLILTGPTLAAVLELFRDRGVGHIYVKSLAANDNSKNKFTWQAALSL